MASKTLTRADYGEVDLNMTMVRVVRSVVSDDFAMTMVKESRSSDVADKQSKKLFVNTYLKHRNETDRRDIIAQQMSTAGFI